MYFFYQEIFLVKENIEDIFLVKYYAGNHESNLKFN